MRKAAESMSDSREEQKRQAGDGTGCSDGGGSSLSQGQVGPSIIHSFLRGAPAGPSHCRDQCVHVRSHDDLSTYFLCVQFKLRVSFRVACWCGGLACEHRAVITW